VTEIVPATVIGALGTSESKKIALKPLVAAGTRTVAATRPCESTGSEDGNVALLVTATVVPAGALAIGMVRFEVYPLGAGSGAEMSGAPPLPLPIESGTVVATAIAAGAGVAVGDATTFGGVTDVVPEEHAAIAASAMNEPSWT